MIVLLITVIAMGILAIIFQIRREWIDIPL